tara:strand:+ start:132 stop:305 length:174 start_codon:yes stop_codon:yes gene_type:complete
LIQNQNHHFGYNSAFGVPLPECNAHLLEKQGVGCFLINPLPYTDYNNIYDNPEIVCI